MHAISYPDRLKALNLDRLEIRRIRTDLLFTYQILFGLVDINSSSFFTVTKLSTTRGHCYKLFYNYSRVDARKNFFCNRVIKIWNSLPASDENFKTLGSFKRFIATTDLSMYITSD
jgi:hypothetical protein